MSLMVMILFFAWNLFASEIQHEKIYLGRNLKETSVNAVVDHLPKGSLVVMGEIHDLKSHHAHQVEMIEALIEAGHTVSLGMEFLQYPYQDAVKSFLKDELSEENFLKEIQWGGNPFEFYYTQMKLAFESSQNVWALNAPSALTRKISKQGLDSLTETERELLPPQFTLGRVAYFERFSADMKEMAEAHGMQFSDATIQRYFAAQSTWDDTMAWKIQEARNVMDPETTMVVLVGDFHVAYGGGLPDRLKLRGSGPVTVISQVNLSGMTAEEIEAMVDPDSEKGIRAHYIWTADEAEEKTN